MRVRVWRGDWWCSHGRCWRINCFKSPEVHTRTPADPIQSPLSAPELGVGASAVRECGLFEKLFQTLFLYRPVVFQQGEFRFDITTGSFVALALVGLVVLL